MAVITGDVLDRLADSLVCLHFVFELAALHQFEDGNSGLAENESLVFVFESLDEPVEVVRIGGDLQHADSGEAGAGGFFAGELGQERQGCKGERSHASNNSCHLLGTNEAGLQIAARVVVLLNKSVELVAHGGKGAGVGDGRVVDTVANLFSCGDLGPGDNAEGVIWVGCVAGFFDYLPDVFCGAVKFKLPGFEARGLRELFAEDVEQGRDAPAIEHKEDEGDERPRYGLKDGCDGGEQSWGCTFSRHANLPAEGVCQAVASLSDCAVGCNGRGTGVDSF